MPNVPFLGSGPVLISLVCTYHVFTVEFAGESDGTREADCGGDITDFGQEAVATLEDAYLSLLPEDQQEQVRSILEEFSSM